MAQEGPADVQIGVGLRFKAYDEAPDFTLKDHNGKDQSLYDFRGTNVLLQFYNLDETRASGLTHAYKAHEQDFKHAGIVLLCLNQATLPENFRFHHEQRVPFPLLSDADREKRKPLRGSTGTQYRENRIIAQSTRQDSQGREADLMERTVSAIWPKMSDSDANMVAKQAIALVSKDTTAK